MAPVNPTSGNTPMTRFDILLHPSLKTVEDRLRGPSTDLVQRWIDNPRSLSAETLRDLEQNPMARELREVMSQPEPALGGEDDQPIPPMSAALQDLIQRRDAALQHRFPASPRAGQILAVDRVIGPDGPLDHDLPGSLAVCLDHPTETPEVWYGWLVSAEVDYAGYWDLVLEAADGPCDPQAGMVQLWNPVRIYLPSTGPVLAKLSAERLAALRSLAVDYVTGRDPDPALASPGRMLPRHTDDGLMIMTGTPLLGEDDPRHRYQDLYHTAAEAVGAPARLAMEKATAGNPLADLRDWLRVLWTEASSRASLPLLPVPAVEQALSEPGETEEIWFTAGDTGLRLGVEVTPRRDQVVFTVSFHNTGDRIWTVEILESRAGETDYPPLMTLTVNLGERKKQFISGDMAHLFRISHDGKVSYELPLPVPPRRS